MRARVFRDALNLFLSFPVGIIGMIFWYFGKRGGANRLNRIVLITHTIGLVVAIVSARYPAYL
jgi:hypothetical protein